MTSNSKSGFICGRFANANVPPRPPPLCDNIEWNDIGQHLNNRGSDQTGSPSPFISTSNLLVCGYCLDESSHETQIRVLISFVGTIRMAMKRADASTYISVIDTTKLDSRSIYHVRPFYQELKKKRPFYRGGFNYTGMLIPSNSVL